MLPKVDEFAFVLLAGVLTIVILAIALNTPTEGAPLVSNNTMRLTMRPGETQTFEFVVSGKTALTALNLTAAGDISSWMRFDKNDFDIADGATSKVTVTVRAPPSLTNSLYTGRVIVTGSGGRATFSVNIEITQRATARSTKVFDLGQFTVSFNKGTFPLVSKSDVSVYGGYFGSTPAMLSGSISDENLGIATGADVQLDIGSTNGLGNLIVLFNGNEVYNGAAGVGMLTIPVSKDILNNSNVVLIQAAAPGMQFWTSTIYQLSSAKLEVTYSGESPQTFTFDMSGEQVANFKQFDLFWAVDQGNTVAPLPTMAIHLNSQIIYWEVPPYITPYLDRTFKEDMFGNKLNLNSGANTIKFSFDRNAVYSVSDATLTIEYYS